jgi:hypothetical protein
VTVYLSRTSLTVLAIEAVLAILDVMEHRAAALIRAVATRIEEAGR